DILFVFVLDELVNSLCRSLSCAHGKDNGGCSGHCISAGVYAFLGGSSGLLICDDTFSSVHIQTDGGGRNQRVGRGSQGHDHGIRFHLELGSLDHNRTSSSGSIRFAQLHAHTADTFHPSVF